MRQLPQAPIWKALNGGVSLAGMLGRQPELSQFVLAARGQINTTVDDTTTTLEAQVPADSDLYVLSASLCITDQAVDGEGFTNVPALSPEYWWAHVEISEDRGGKRLSNAPVSVGSIFGRGDRPFMYPAPWYLKAGTRVRVGILNESEIGSNPSTFWVCFNALRAPANAPKLPYPFLLEPRLLDVLSSYYGAGELASVEPFFYSLFTGHSYLGKKTGFVPMATESPTFTVSGHDFACCYLMGEIYDDSTVAYLNSAAAGLADHLVQLVLDEGKVRLMDRPVAFHSLFGHGKRWMKLPQPLIIPAGHSLTAIVTPGKLPGSPEQRFLDHLTFAGVKLYRRGHAAA